MSFTLPRTTCEATFDTLRMTASNALGGRGWGGGVLDRRDVLDLMHGRSRMTVEGRGGALLRRLVRLGVARRKQDIILSLVVGLNDVGRTHS